MRTRRMFTVLALAAALVSPGCGSRGKDKPKDELAERSFTLPNGLRVDLVSGRCADGDKVALALLLDFGPDHDPPGRSGMAHVIKRLLGGGAGAVDNGREHTLYTAEVAGPGLAGELETLAARLAKPDVTEESLGRARAQALEELARMRGGDPASTAQSLAVESVQPSRGNGWRGGIAAEIEAITLADVEAFWQAHVKPGRARLVLVGGFDPDKAHTSVEKAFAPLPAGEAPALRPPTPTTVIGTLVMGDAPTAVAMAIPAPAPSDPLYPAFLVLAARLMKKPEVELGWEASYDPLRRPETLFVTGPVLPGEQPEPGAARIRGEVDKLLAQPFSPEDVPAARERFEQFLGVALGRNPQTGREIPVSTRRALACRADPRTFAAAQARRAQLGVDGSALAAALDATTAEQIKAAAGLFEAKRTAAVIAGGKL